MTFAQQEPTTADEVLSKYMEAVGADRYASVTTFMERGENNGNLTSFGWGSISQRQSGGAEHGTYEFYFKSPNLRFSSSTTDQQRIIAIGGCNGKVGWYISPDMKRTEFKPKPGSAGQCEEGFKPPLRQLREPKVKIRLLGKKEIEGHMAWEIKADDPTSTASGTYYFDAETHLLLRHEKQGMKVTYSDYREAGGIRFPFTTITEFTNFKVVTTVRELKINAPIDDAQFAERQVKGRVIEVDPAASRHKDNATAAASTSPELSATPRSEISSLAPSSSSAGPTPAAAPPSAAAAPPNTASIVEVNFPNFTSCTMAEIQLVVPELKNLKPAADQEKLATLLDKVGAKTLDIARNTPNLISRETVTQPEDGGGATRHEYDYLILARIDGRMVNLDEFRVDLKSGYKFETDPDLKDESLTRESVERASRELAASEPGGTPASQGFATSWVHFYPPNQKLNTYRYLGEQKMDGQRTLVLTFAQNPANVRRPAMFHYHGKSVPMFLQGVAWVDPSDFRILRVRTDLLMPIPEVALHRVTADTRFALTRIAAVAKPLSLPREVTVESEMEGGAMRETHKYSEYRLFRAQSKIKY
jgi:hypothetical protein